MRQFAQRVIGVLGLVAATTLGVSMIASADTATLAPEAGSSNITQGGLKDSALDTPFNLTLAVGAHCTGNASAGYVVRSYFIGSAVTLSSVDFGALGLPLPASGTGSGSSFISTLPNASGAAFQLNPGSSAPFLVTGLPQLSMYRMVNKSAIPAGTYHIGIACVGPDNHVDGSNFWDVSVSITSQAATAMAWELGATTTSTSTTSTSTSTSTSTTSTTTTLAGQGGSSSTSTSSTTTTTGTGAASTSSTSVGSSAGGVPVTGSSPWRLVVLALLVLFGGRMVLLSARPVRVLPPRSR